MSPETRTCQNCKKKFQIEPEDFVFYEKMQVPPPTWCPDCRMMRRMQFMNFRTWYNRTVDGKPALSVYASDSPIQVMSLKEWWSDEWDATDYARDYDFSKPFFAQFAELYQAVPRPNMLNDLQSVNCDYCNDIGNAKNCYLSTTTIDTEDAYYSTTAIFCREMFDCLWMFKSDLCYECIDTQNSRGCLFSQNIDNCLDSVFLFDCRNVSNCIGCVGLRSGQYYIFNKQYSKEEYLRFLGENVHAGGKKLQALQAQFEAFKLTRPHRHAQIFHSVDCTGDNINGAKNCEHCFDLSQDLENLKYVTYAGLGIKDSYDCYNAGNAAELMYEGMLVGSNSSRLLFSINILYSSINLQYCDSCVNSSDLFGCVGMKKKQYCILNKQYTKDEYQNLLPKIIQHMNDMPYIDRKGRVYKYGEFFPAEISPFAHNETIAGEYFPMTKEQAVSQGYAWRHPEEKKYKITLNALDLPDKIDEVGDAIVSEVIGCEHAGTCKDSCTKAFRVIAKELEFYRRMSLPLPRLCPNCRYAARFKKRNPLKLWDRTCAKCSKNIQTSYAPGRPEIVYCESCYQREIL